MKRRTPAAGRALFWPVLLAITTWPSEPVQPAAGLDPSWMTGLNLAAERGLTFGQDVVFAYGPLGFLHFQPVYFADEIRLTVLYTLVLAIVQAAVLLTALRLTFNAWQSVLLAYLALAVAQHDFALVTATAGAIVIAWRARPLKPWVATLLGAAAAVELLGKVSVGVVVFGALLLGLLALPGRRRTSVLAYGGGTVLATIALWLMLGGSLGGLPDFVRYQLSISAGYAQAMGLEMPEIDWLHELTALVLVVLAWGTWVSLRDAPMRMRRALWLAVALFGYVTFKEASIRHDPGHALLLFAAVFALVPALGWGRARRTQAWLATAVAGAALLAAFGAQGSDPGQHVDPEAAEQRFERSLRITISANDRNTLIAAGRTAMVEAYGLDPETLRLLGDHTVHVAPWEVGVVWAHGLHWHPLPAFQDYQAYTPALDDLNANELAAHDAPERILRQSGTDIDGRLEAWDPPRQHLEMLCRYRQISTAGPWQVLAWGNSRCGATQPLATVEAKIGDTIKIPVVPDDSLVIVRVEGLDVGGFERVVSLLYKPGDRFATTDGSHTNRIIPATLGDGLLLSASPGADYPAPFNLAPNAKTIAFGVEGEQPGDRDIRIRFEAVAVTGPAVAG